MGPKLIPGGISIDDRGSVRFINTLDFKEIRRFYIIENHRQNFVRAWHGHKKEAKYLLCVEGSFLAGVVKINSWKNPSADSKTQSFVLSDQNTQMLYIPPGFANGLMNLSQNAKILVFSTATLDESKQDDYRFPAKYWDIWNIEER